MENKSFLYLNMIVKHDEPIEMVKRSIDSIKDYVDDIYITVTYDDKKLPSSHPLLKLLKEYKTNITQFQWVDDFAAARQYALEQVPQGDNHFVYWHDADDVLEGSEKIPLIIKDMASLNHSSVFLDYWYLVDYDENGKVFDVVVKQTRERIIRNNNTFKWIGELHETLIEQRSENIVKVEREDCIVVHHSNADRGDMNIARNVRILEKMLTKQKGKDPRTLIYLAKGYYDFARMTKGDESKSYYNKALKLFYAYLEGHGEEGKEGYIVPSGWREERATAWGHVAEIAVIQKEPTIAIEAYEKAMHEAPEFPSYYIDLASVYVMLGDYKKAKQYLLLGSATPEPKTTIVTYPKELKKRALQVSIDVSLHEQNLDKAHASAKMLVEMLPYEDYPKETLEEIERLIEFNRACQSVVFLGKFLEKRKKTKELGKLVESIPSEMHQEKFATEMRHRFLPPRIWGEDEITILCGPGWEKWSPKSVTTGIGGSEEAVVRLSKELAKLGWKVTVYGDPRDDAGEYAGVTYKPWNDINAKDGFNTLILWRSVGFVDVNPKSKFTMLWLHDVPNNPEFTEERLNKIDKIAVLSEYHKSLLRMNKNGVYKVIPDHKIFVTSNGISDINIKKWKGDSKKIAYISSPDRGLIYLLNNWGKIIKEVPNATLDVYYGFDVFDTLNKDNPERMKFKNKIMSLMRQDGITYHGRIGHDALHYQLSRTGIWAYPTDFEEISCHPAGTRVTTKRGEVNIEDILIEDKVLTHTGKYNSINKIMRRRHNGHMIEISVQSGDKLELTPEHPLYIINGKSSWRSFNDIKGAEPQWIEAKNITINDCVLFPRYKSKTSKVFHIPIAHRQNNFFTTDNPVPEKIDVTPELSWWLGYFAGDGTALIKTGKVGVLVANSHPEHIRPVLDGFSAFGIEVKSRKLRGCVEYYIQSYRLAKVLRSLYYDNNKKMLSEHAMNQYGLNGILAADGHKNERTSIFTNTSLRLIGQVRQLLSEIGISGRVTPRIHKNGNKSYSIGWTTQPRALFYGVSDDYIIKRIADIKFNDFEGDVYNLEVENDNSYVSNGHIVHNCISAMKAQACGAIPVVTNYAALQETVRNGLKVDVDITMEEGQDKYVKAIVGLLKDEKKQKEIRENMMTWAMDYFQWKHVAATWDTLFRVKVQNPEKRLEIIEQKEEK